MPKPSVIFFISVVVIGLPATYFNKYFAIVPQSEFKRLKHTLSGLDQSPNWSILGPLNKIPDTPLTGEIFGNKHSAFTVKITKNNILSIKSNDHPSNRRESSITIFINFDGTKKTWWAYPNQEKPHPPHVHMNFPKRHEGTGLSGTLIYTQQYSMKLELTEINESTVKGRLHLSLPDYKRSYLVGSFEAERM